VAGTMASHTGPALFRLLLPAKDLDASVRFYETLLGTPGRRVAGGRVYFDCGPVILGILDYSETDAKELPSPAEALYFATGELERLHRRARQLGCLSPELIHNDPDNPAGEVVVRPWGERSFYAADPSGNPLCFVDAATLFTGTPDQVAALADASGSAPRSARSARPAKAPSSSRARRKPRRR
jgi:catechol 2,3-dioxygenase-like lactoylglutathione lyase family enzyme